MVALTGKLGSVKRFGARYGRSLKIRLALVEVQQKNSYKCPKCHSKNVKRVAAGIWACGKCKKKMTGRAYSLSEAGTKSGKIDDKIEDQVIRSN